MALKIDATLHRKLTCTFKNDMRSLGNFHQNTGKSKNWDFDGIFSSKVKYVWAKNWHGSFVSYQWKMKQNLKRNWVVSSKLTWGIWQISMGLFWTKYIMFDLKKYRGVMFGSTEYWCNIWRKTDLCFHKWHKELWQIFTRARLKV